MPQQKKNTTLGGKAEKFRSRIRSIGNSKGVILNSQLLQKAGINVDDDISIEAGNGIITISQARSEINTDLNTWDAHFKKAIKEGHLPEGDLFGGLQNEFDKTEW